VITFPGEPALGSAGEICVSAEAAARFAGKTGRPFSEELTLYLVHGWLHLAGHDDHDPVRKRSMRRAEGRAMRLLKDAKAVPVFAFSSARAKHPLT
jgi:probable rRNA maturation factor